MSNKEDILNKYVCVQPFKHIEYYKDHATLCCPTWLSTQLRYKKNEDGTLNYDVWNSDTANEIRKSIMDGSYSHCSKTACPHLSTLINTKKASGFFIEKEKFSISVVTFLIFLSNSPVSIFIVCAAISNFFPDFLL
jgi:hypothetical protein